MNLKPKITAILVDDEPKAIRNLTTLLTTNCPNITILSTCNSVDEAVIHIKNNKPDVVFLDIEMPKKSGFELFDETDEKFQTIFVTAYDEFALKAFEVSAVDYLLKPIEIKRLKNAVDKLKPYSSFNEKKIETLKSTIATSKISQIIVPYKESQLIIKTSDIVCIQANQSYSIIHCNYNNEIKSYTYSKPLSYLNNILSENMEFYRTNRSWLVNTKKVNSVIQKEHKAELQGNIEITISKNKLVEFIKILNSA